MIRTATPHDAPRLAATLARAFHDDPVARYALPSERRRPAQLRRVYTQRLRALLPHGLVCCDADGRGAALWAPPGRWRTWFAVIDEVTLPCGPRLWLMWRPPR